jgi:hypothetical protein
MAKTLRLPIRSAAWDDGDRNRKAGGFWQPRVNIHMARHASHASQPCPCDHVAFLTSNRKRPPVP